MESFLIPLQKEFVTRVQVIKERMSEKSKETWGRWMTEERMRKDKDMNLSNKSIQAIKEFCNKFPETHKRPDYEKNPCFKIDMDLYIDIAGVSFIFGGMIRNWKYDDRVFEYFVVIEDKASEKQAELDRQRETTELDVSCQEGM